MLRLLSRARSEPWRRNVLRLSVARFVSRAGSQAAYIALVALVYQRTHGSGAWIAATLVASFAVRALLSPWAGLLGDRFDRRRVMIVSDLAAAAAFVAIAFAHAPWLLVLLAVVAAIAELPFLSSSNALLVMLVPEEERAWATASRDASASAGLLLGGAAGGLLVAAFGAPTAFLVNAVSFVGSVLLIARLTGGPFRAALSTDLRHRGVWAGLRLVWQEPTVRLTLASTGLSFLGIGMINVAEYPLFVRLGGGSVAFGAALAGWAVGQVAGARYARRATDPYRERRTLIGGRALTAAAIGVAGLIPFAPAVVVVFALGGVGSGAAAVAVTLIVQRRTPDAVRARAFAAADAVAATSIGIAMVAGGALLAVLNPARVCVLAGGLGLLAMFVAVRVPPRGRRPLPPVTESARASDTETSGLTRLVPAGAR